MLCRYAAQIIIDPLIYCNNEQPKALLSASSDGTCRLYVLTRPNFAPLFALEDLQLPSLTGTAASAMRPAPHYPPLSCPLLAYNGARTVPAFLQLELPTAACKSMAPQLPVFT
jgi:hypothetical protein